MCLFSDHDHIPATVYIKMLTLLTYLKEINHISKFLSVEFMRGRIVDHDALNVKKMLHILLLFVECLSLFV